MRIFASIFPRRRSLVVRRKGWEAVGRLVSLDLTKNIPNRTKHLFRMNLAALIIPGVIRQEAGGEGAFFSIFIFFCSPGRLSCYYL